MDLKQCARFLIASSFLVSGLAETLSATGLVIELLPGAQASLGMQSLAVGGPLQIVGGAWLASGRKTRRVLALLVGYLVLVSLFGNLPGIIHPDPSGKALAGMITNMAVIGGLLHWMQSEGDHARSGDA